MPARARSSAPSAPCMARKWRSRWSRPISSTRKESVCVPEFSLISAPPLAGYDKTVGGIRLRAPEGITIVSIALPLGGEAAAEKAVKSAYGVALPEVGKSVVAKEARLVRLGVEQAF